MSVTEPSGYVSVDCVRLEHIRENSDLRDGVGGDLVAISVQALHLAVIGPFVRDVKRGSNRTAVRVESSVLEQVFVKILVQIVDRIVERQQDQLRHVLHFQTA